MSDTRATLAEFVRERSGREIALPDDADLFDCLGIDGDDAFDFMDAFVTRFSVDVRNYRWYFHHGEEGLNLAGFFFRPPYRRVKREPITLKILSEAMITKQWPLRYPAHELPKVRWDLRVNILFFFVWLIGVAAWAWHRLVR